ncbi:MAG: chromate transporter [Bryobacteraceae bacterium]|nr:chromate transporter [Bryobacteraceae bacterium]
MTEFVLLYLLFLKATLSSFSGMTALPILRQELVLTHRLTDRQLNTAIVTGRLTPGPKGGYIVAVGQTIGGWRGATAAWLAMVTPALLVLPLLYWLGRHAKSPPVKRALDAVMLTSVGLSLTAILPLARDAIDSPAPALLVAGSTWFFIRAKVETVWLILAGAVLMLGVKMLN